MKCRVYAAMTMLAMGTAGCAPMRAPTPGTASPPAAVSDWQTDFGITNRILATSGRNAFFILEPGFRIVLQGKEERVTITVLDETVDVAGVTTRVVEEREWKNGELVEVTRNFFALCAQTKDVFYFGEDVDNYTDGKVTGHSSAWRAGQGNAKPGLIMPGKPAVGMKYYQELAPGVAMDRAEVVSLAQTLKTPAGTFTNCLRTQEGTALDPDEKEFKTYAPGVGMIQDADLLVTEYGFIKK